MQRYINTFKRRGVHTWSQLDFIQKKPLSPVSDLRMKHFIVQKIGWHSLYWFIRMILQRNCPHKHIWTDFYEDAKTLTVPTYLTLTENDANDEADGFIIKIMIVSHGGGLTFQMETVLFSFPSRHLAAWGDQHFWVWRGWKRSAQDECGCPVSALIQLMERKMAKFLLCPFLCFLRWLQCLLHVDALGEHRHCGPLRYGILGCFHPPGPSIILEKLSYIGETEQQRA